MAEKTSNFASSNLTFAKVVATPTLISWSQAYNAGGLFAVLSLTKESENTLGILGKEILNTFEQEYFTLENKNLTSIKEAVLNTYKKIPEDVSSSLVVTAIIDNILYVFSAGGGKVIIKRGEKVGQILSGEKGEDLVSSSSGFLEDNDLVVVETSQFAKIIPNEELIKSFDHFPPSEIAEALSPKIHGNQEGAAAAIIIAYKNLVKEKEAWETEENENTPEPSSPSSSSGGFLQKFPEFLKKFKGKINLNRLPLNHSKKLLLSLVIIIAFVFIASVFFAVKKQDEAKIKAAFQEIYPLALNKYNDGQRLLCLNKNVARDYLLEAEKILNNGKTKFKPSSNEEKQIIELLKKTEDAIVLASEVNTVEAKEVDSGKSQILSSEIKNSGASYFTQSDTEIYFIDSKAISAENKSSEKVKTVLKNDNSWSNIGGFGTYLGNIYVLDKSVKQIIKFVPSGDGFGKANYFTNEVSPVSKATSMAIDGSVWILLQDGNILKFTKGKPDNFSISGLDKPFLNPTVILTNASSEKLYILDKGNSRIVILNKDGSYQSQYQSKILKSAKDFEIKEADKKIFILSGDKVWEITIK